MEIWDYIPDYRDLLRMSSEDIGSFILQILVFHRKETDQCNKYVFVELPFRYGTDRYPHTMQKVLERVLMEAWLWLENNGLIAPVPMQTNALAGECFVTRKGRQLASPQDFEAYRKASLLPQDLLHEKLRGHVVSSFMRGEYDTAVFQAFKYVEMTVREAGGFSHKDYGTDMMRRAFHPNNGPLTDRTLPEAEREGLAALFAGAIGCYKNPHSHRNIVLDDPTDAVEMIMLANHLLRIIDARAATRGTSGAP